MPFELGIEVGCRSVGGKFAVKRCLVLERDIYRYQSFISDIAGNDIKCHEGSPEKLIKQLRTWFVRNGTTLPSGSKIWISFNEFYEAFQMQASEQGYTGEDIDEMPVSEFINFVREFCNSAARGFKA
jgi:hypothetical protein